MTDPRPVIAALAEYRNAIAELPLTVREADDSAEAIVVVSGEGLWWNAARTAFEAGAAAIVVAHPRSVPAGDGVLDRMPVIIDRPRLRADVVADALAFGSEPRAISALVRSGREHDSILGDTIGWLRRLADGPLRVATTSGRDTGVALVERADGAGPVIALTLVRGPSMPDEFRIDALGEQRLEVEATRFGVRVAAADEHGTRLAARRFEEPPRLALRRALEALETGDDPHDLAELRHDLDVAAEVTRGATA
jgi:hypothetical protein